MTQQKTLRVNRRDGLNIGRWFVEDPTLQVLEIPIGEANFDTKEIKKTHRAREQFKDNIYIQRFFNRVVPMVLLYGYLVHIATIFYPVAGLAVMFVFAFIDISIGTISYREEIKHAK